MTLTSELYAGLDFALATTNIRVVDSDGRVILEAQVTSDPAAIREVLASVNGEDSRRS